MSNTEYSEGGGYGPGGLRCPLCRSSQVRIMDALYTVRLVDRGPGKPPQAVKCPLVRCLSCGRTFSEIEAGEGPELEEDGGPS